MLLDNLRSTAQKMKSKKILIFSEFLNTIENCNEKVKIHTFVLETFYKIVSILIINLKLYIL